MLCDNQHQRRVTYQELPPTLPPTPLSSHSLPIISHESQISQLREATPRRRSLSRVDESWELTEVPRKPKLKERKGER